MDEKKESFAAKMWRLSWITVLTFLVLWGYKTVALNMTLFNPVSKIVGEYSMDDFFYTLLADTDEPDTSSIVSIVDITDVYSRRDLADLLEQIEAEGPVVIGIDCVFEGLKEDHVGDSMIADVGTSYDNLVFAYKLISDSWDGEQWRTTQNSFFADSLGELNQAFVDFPRSLYNNMKRSMIVGDYVKGELRPSLCKVVADKYAGQETVPLTNREMRVNFSPKEYPVIPPDSVAEYGDLIADRVVLVGCMREESDMHYTPQGKIAGTKLLGYGIDTLLNNKEIHEVDGWMLWLASFLVVLTMLIVFEYYGRAVGKIKNPLVRYLLTSVVVKGIIRFLWMAVAMWGAFLLFCNFNVSLNLAWALAAVTFTASADNLYGILKNYITGKSQS